MKLTSEQQQILLENLPDKFKQAIIRFDWKNEVIGIGRIFELNDSQLNELETQVFLMMTGELPSAEFEKTLIEKLNTTEDSAGRIMNMVNTSIFAELQERASKTNDIIEPETIHHHEIKNVLSSEGIELVDDSEIQNIDNKLHHEVSAILSGISTNQNPVSTIDNSPIADTKNRSKIDSQAHNDEPTKETSYNEPINEKDLEGIKHHRTDTTIIEKHTKNSTHQTSLPTLDEHLFNNPFIAQGDTINLSPSKEEQISEDGNFLEHLKTTQ